MPFIKNVWYMAAWSTELEAGVPASRMVIGQPMVLYRGTEGVVALENRCSHRCAPLSSGRVEGSKIRCGYHGMLFDRQGTCVDIPGQDGVPPGFNVRAYPVVEKEGAIWVWPGDAALADPEKVPTSRIDEGGIEMMTGMLDYDADYQLLHDNLCDFSHVGFVHEKTLASGHPDWASKQPTVTNLKDGIRVSRWFEGMESFPRPGVPPEPFDQSNAYDFTVPGVLLLQVEMHPLGTAKQLNFGTPPASMEGASAVTRSFQVITPTIENHCRYFFSASHPVDPCPGALEFTMRLIRVAFDEDHRMIQSQQASIDRFPGVQLRNTKHDVGLVRLRRLIANRIRQEQAEDRSVAA